MNPSSPFHLHPLNASFSQACLAINRACPIEAEFTLRFDREPDFFGWPKRVFDSFEYLGIFVENRLVGYFLTGVRTGWNGLNWSKWAYLGDYRIMPEFRGRHFGFRALTEVIRRIPDNIGIGCFIIAQGNRAAGCVRFLGILKTEVRHSGLLEVYSLPVFREPNFRGHCTIRSARPDDLPAIKELVRHQWEGRLFGPNLSGDLPDYGWKNALSQGHMLVAQRGNGVCGAVAWTDLGDVRRTTVVRYPMKSWPIRALWSAVRLFYRRVADLPKAGEAMRSATVILLEADGDDIRVLRELLVGVRRAQAGQGIHLVQVAGFIGQNVLKALKGMLRVRFCSDVWIATRQNTPFSDSLHRPPVIDLALI
jgi:hypothetical protein